MQNSPKMRGAIIGARAGLISGAIAILISQKYPFFIYAYVVLLLTSLPGALCGVWYIQRRTLGGEWLKLLFWSNTLAWIVPPIGFFVCAATRTINFRNHGADREQFMRLAGGCFILSFINALILAWYVT
jgi:hypothetical protein